ncbi:MAG: hypothetical protein HFG26_01530 [Provencibacterium sp.]|jgi:hypothetical protein|nr:hypothetical protein [Provencibacterium sp.]
MRGRKFIYYLLGIGAILSLCLLAGVTVRAKNRYPEVSFTLQNVIWKDGKPYPAAKTDGYYQLAAAKGQGSITFPNNGGIHLTVMSYTRSASFISWGGNQPIRGYTHINMGAEGIQRLRYHPSRKQLLACDDQEVFCIFPDSNIENGQGYQLSTMFGNLSASDFSVLPLYGVCLEYSKDGTFFQELPSKYSVKPLEMEKAVVYQETHTAAIPEDAAYLRIALSYASQLSDPYGQVLPNPREDPVAVSQILLSGSDQTEEPKPAPSSKPSEISSSSATPEDLLPEPSSSSVPSSSGGMIDSSSSLSSSEGNGSSSSSSFSQSTVLSSDSSAEEVPSTWEGFSYSRKPIREPGPSAWTETAPHRIVLDSTEEYPPKTDRQVEGESSSASAVSTSEALEKEIQKEEKTSRLLTESKEKMEIQTEPEAASGSTLFLIFYLVGVVAVAAFWAGRASGNSKK